MIKENFLDRLTGSGTSHIVEIGVLIKVCILSLNVIAENYFDRSTRSGTAHIIQIIIFGCWVYGKYDSH